MSKPLKVLVHGTGFAGQGHAEAFKDAGTEIIGIVGRTETIVQQVAQDMACLLYTSPSPRDRG